METSSISLTMIETVGRYMWKRAQKTQCILKKYPVLFNSWRVYESKRLSIAAMVTAVDQAVGEVYTEMETQGLLDNAIIVFTSDVYI